ncbi:hypothetical protein [Prosthecobacter sp.]|uniref:hypothetical protein n=1 Tax=Prosthecobacter sp. TaxID=1965333 RepID=UPI003783822C
MKTRTGAFRTKAFLLAVFSIACTRTFISAQSPEPPLQGKVTATLDPGERFQSGVSLLWSPSGQAAWDKMREFHKVKTIDLVPPTPIADVLNQFQWDPAKTLPDGTVVYGGEDSEALRAEIRETLRKRVGPQAAAMIGPFRPPGRLDQATERLGSALFVSCLSHSPRFPVGFVVKRNIFAFSNGQKTTVEGFGSEGPHAANLSDALQILADDLKGTFILKLPFFTEGKARPSFLTLAKIPGLLRIENGIQRVRQALKSPLPPDQAIKQNDKWWRYSNQLSAVDKFWMPKLKTTISCDYGELIGKTYLHEKVGTTDRYWMIREAQQLLNFRLDEEGSMTQAVFKISPDFLSSSGEPTTAPGTPKIETLPFLPRIFSFDGPFLAALWMNDAEWPYLACWVDSEEVLLKK